jgi:hypothetical protein
MKTNKITKKAKITQLERELREALAGQVHTHYFACKEIGKASMKHLMSSGVVLTLTVPGGRELFQPVLIHDGLSDETIAALKNDLKRSFDTATIMKPKELES